MREFPALELSSREITLGGLDPIRRLPSVYVVLILFMDGQGAGRLRGHSLDLGYVSTLEEL